MSLQTLHNSLSEAALRMGVNPNNVLESQRPELVLNDDVTIQGYDFTFLRAHCGRIDEDDIAKGGLRRVPFPTTVEEGVDTVLELSGEMSSKNTLRNLRFLGKRIMGGKGVIIAKDKNSVSSELLMRHYADSMQDAGLAGYETDVPAPDVGTNGFADAYALRYRENNPNDPFWKASITGKSTANGGLDFRPRATGWGSHATQKALMDYYGLETVDDAVIGFGAAGAWQAFYISEDPRTRLNAISDRYGMIYTDHPDGFSITEDMVKSIGDNKDFEGDKIAELEAYIRKNQPGIDIQRQASEKILYCPTDFLVPAALGNVITAQNVRLLGAKKGIIETANGPTTSEAHQYLTANNYIIAPDTVANGGGVDCSMMEMESNVSGITPETEDVKKALEDRTKVLVSEVLGMSEKLDSQDLRLGAAAVGIARWLDDSMLLRELSSAN